MSVLTVIPARMGSTRFPGKVLARLKGKTMVEWCWRAAKAAKLGPVLVATDSRSVADEVRRFGGEAVMTPVNCPSGSDRVWLAASKRREATIVNFQGDMPLLKPSTLRAAVTALTGNADIATVVIPLKERKRRRDPNVVKVALTKNGRCLYFSRADIPFGRDGAAVESFEHLGIYVFRRGALRRFVNLKPSPLEKSEKLEQLRALEDGMTISAAIVNERQVSVDVPKDLVQAEKHLRRGKK